MSSVQVRTPRTFVTPAGKEVTVGRYYVYCFPETGETVYYRKVSGQMHMDARRQREKSRPKPLVIEVEVAGRTVLEEQTDDPEYLVAMQKWEEELNDTIVRMTLKAAILSVDNPSWREEAREYAAFATEFDAAPAGPSDDDMITYIVYVASGSVEGFQEFWRELIAAGQVTEQEVQEAIAMFRPAGDGGDTTTVSGKAPVRNKDQEERNVLQPDFRGVPGRKVVDNNSI